jgi:hypothetical protein
MRAAEKDGKDFSAMRIKRIAAAVAVMATTGTGQAIDLLTAYQQAAKSLDL